MDKQQVLYVHGGEAYSQYDNYLHHLQTVKIEPFTEPSKRWSHTLRADLGEAFEVFMPEMPNKHNAKYAEWKIWFERHFEFLRDGVVLVGWSQGAYFFVRYLTENNLPFKPKALILVAAPFEPADFGGEDGGDFAFNPAALHKLVKKVPDIHILHSKDDFVVPYEHSLKYKEALPGAELVTFADKNHFLIEEFPELVQLIKAVA